MFDQILVPTDGSEPSASAAQKGVMLAAEHGATVHALSAVEPVPLGTFTSGPEPSSAEHGEIVDQQKSEAQAAIDTVVDRCEEHGVDVVEALVYGTPHQEIVEYAEEEGIDLVVMGTHGRSGAQRFLIGSVAEKVVRQSPAPVLTVRSLE